MSNRAVESIMGRLMLDAEFSRALLAFPDQTLEDFDLTEAEKDILKRIDSETLDFLIMTLAERIPTLAKRYVAFEKGLDQGETGLANEITSQGD